VRLAGEVVAPTSKDVHVPGSDFWMSNGARFETDLDSIGQLVNGIVVDFIDHGSRSGTAPRALLSTLRVAARRSVPVFVLDRPNPITGEHLEGPVLDSASAASDGVYGLPQRHGMTVGEMAQYFNAVGKIGATLSVVPVRGWRRTEWPTDRGLSAAGWRDEWGMLQSAFALCAATDLKCDRDRDGMVVRSAALGQTLASTLNDRLMPGVEFDGKAGSLLARIENRDQATPSRILAAIFAELVRAKVMFTIDLAKMAELTGSTAYADAILAGEDSDTIIDKQLPLLVDFRRRVREYLIYR
jgi:hypothetical protein